MSEGGLVPQGPSPPSGRQAQCFTTRPRKEGGLGWDLFKLGSLHSSSLQRDHSSIITSTLSPRRIAHLLVNTLDTQIQQQKLRIILSQSGWILLVAHNLSPAENKGCCRKMYCTPPEFLKQTAFTFRQDVPGFDSPDSRPYWSHGAVAQGSVGYLPDQSQATVHCTPSEGKYSFETCLLRDSPYVGPHENLPLQNGEDRKY
jgi:hypothetical protein